MPIIRSICVCWGVVSAKIEQLLATTAQNVEPDKDLYTNILAQILWYGKDVTPEMWADFSELMLNFQKNL